MFSVLNELQINIHGSGLFKLTIVGEAALQSSLLEFVRIAETIQHEALPSPRTTYIGGGQSLLCSVVKKYMPRQS